MNITYIAHSGFMVEFDKTVLLFDYYKGIIPAVDRNKQFYVFVSHKHSDHFNIEIFNLALAYPHIHFILSKDIKMNSKYMDRRNIPIEARDKITYAAGSQTCCIGEILVETLVSTDAGVAFIVTCEGKAVYHSGDLNWWTWKGEVPAKEAQMEKAFKLEMEKIKGRKFDAAFFPLDPRQEERFFWGFDYFMRNTQTIKVYPMHCWEDFSVIQRLKGMEEAKLYRDRIQDKFF